jgi:hypothetical protein
MSSKVNIPLAFFFGNDADPVYLFPLNKRLLRVIGLELFPLKTMAPAIVPILSVNRVFYIRINPSAFDVALPIKSMKSAPLIAPCPEYVLLENIQSVIVSYVSGEARAYTPGV